RLPEPHAFGEVAGAHSPLQERRRRGRHFTRFRHLFVSLVEDELALPGNAQDIAFAAMRDLDLASSIEQLLRWNDWNTHLRYVPRLQPEPVRVPGHLPLMHLLDFACQHSY